MPGTPAAARILVEESSAYESSAAKSPVAEAPMADSPAAPVRATGKVEAFITRCYQVILGRDPDPDGLSGWASALKSGKTTAAGIISSFMTSSEFLSRNLSNREIVDILYRAMLGRAPDPNGVADWTSRLDAGAPVSSVIAGFYDSNEFRKLCASYGITAGSAQNRAEVYAAVPVRNTVDIDQDKVRAFLTRCYRTILGREPDEDGLDGWLNALLDGKKTIPQIIGGFVNSVEFRNKNYSNAETVGILYRAILDREGDPEGIAGWTAGLDAGKPLSEVIAGFCRSGEFAELCGR